ncbi:cyclic nucleotide-binding domain protein (macronuclear) [Tetrahymena thermophila SB210]|uniref:Cyclic nucleotide-binding domain protein n=1 Tax=Tetrahymena thermophila (strain SB210) TaxID=312017 RepID=I7MLT9_TETTS|nr:cyclic nucleotide-binding domain protein [Tetrahymena thermophila SB210]EAS03056.1 cyclic nucleotide-binding domain protein [Tetrahymena thermophila SB210]|eukprot:XP_001023301.1 cyclic nucleotide-binding domain protein [Tetrahymena thermophila SB210]
MSVTQYLQKHQQTYYQIPIFQKYLNRSDLSYQEKLVLKEGLSRYFIFSKLNEDQLVEAVKHSQYLIFQTKEQIFNIGDYLEYFYVIIKGSVSQYCTEHSYEMAKNKQKQNSDIVLATADSTKQKLFRIKILNEGDYLAEQALLNTEQNHQSALQAVAGAPEVHLLAININMYKQYLQTASRNNLINDIQTMQSNSIFDKWEFDMIRLLYFFSVKQQFYNGQTVFKEEESAKAIYIILKGEFGVYKTFQQSDGKKIKQQGNKNHLSDEEQNESSSEEDEGDSLFNNHVKRKFQQGIGKDGDDEEEDIEEEEQQYQLFNKISKDNSSKPTSQQTQRSKKLSKKTELNESLNYIEDIEDEELDYFRTQSKTMDIKQYKSLNQITKESDEQNEVAQVPLTSKKSKAKSKVFLFPSKDDSATPKMINNQPKNKLFQLYTLGQNQIFGEEDVMKKQSRTFTVKCNSYGGGILLIIRKNIFGLSLLANSSSEIYLKKNLQMKEERFSQRVKLIQENIQKYKNYFFENNEENATPKNPLRAKRKLVEKDCINIDDFMKASKKQVILEKSAKLYDLNNLDKHKKDNAPLFTAQMITEKINTFSNPNLKKIDLFNFKNDICKVENPPSIHTIFENELKKALKNQQSQTQTNYLQGASSNIAAIASNSQPNTQRSQNNQTIKLQQEARFISKHTQIHHKPKFSENNFLKASDPIFQTSISQNNSGFMSTSSQLKSQNQSQHSSNQDNNVIQISNPPLLKKKASKSDPNIKLPPELLNQMGQINPHNQEPEESHNNNPILIQKDKIKRELMIKQQIQKIEQTNQNNKKQLLTNPQTNQNNGNQPIVSRKNKTLIESSSGNLVYVPPLNQAINVPKMITSTKPVKKTIFLETFTKQFFKNMKGVFYKNYTNQQGSLNTYSSIQESLAKHVLDPSIKSFLIQNPGILASKERQVEFLRTNNIQEKPHQKLNLNKNSLKSVPEFKQQDLNSDHLQAEHQQIPNKAYTEKAQKNSKSEIIKVNIFRSNQNAAQSYKFDLNKIKEQNNKQQLTSPEKISPNKYKRTQSAVELDTCQDEEGQPDYQFNFQEENQKFSPLKLQMHSTAEGFHPQKDFYSHRHYFEEAQTLPVHLKSQKIVKQNTLQPQILDKLHFDSNLQTAQLLENKLNLQIQQKQLNNNSTQSMAFSTHQNFFRPSPIKNSSNQMLRSQQISKTFHNLSPEIQKNKGPINRIFGSQSQTNSIDFQDKFSQNQHFQINVNSCNKAKELEDQKQQNSSEQYQNLTNDLFRQKIENDKNMIKMTNLFIQQTPNVSKKHQKLHKDSI